jgi:GntR family transcriptional regulator
MTQAAKPLANSPHRWPLDDTSDVPLHSQLAQRILTEIENRHLQAGDQLPSERELMEMTGTSRATVRHALDTLVQQDVLERVQGRGTFVKMFQLETSLQIVYSFAEQIRQTGRELHDRVLECEVTHASPLIAHKLNLEPGDPIISLHRLRSIGDVPMMLSIAYLPYELCPGLVTEVFGTASLYRLLTEKYNLPVLSATDTLEAIPAEKTVARYLNLQPGNPVMYVKRLAFTRDSLPMHIGHNYIRGDMCRFRGDMHSVPARLELIPPERLMLTDTE